MHGVTMKFNRHPVDAWCNHEEYSSRFSPTLYGLYNLTQLEVYLAKHGNNQIYKVMKTLDIRAMKDVTVLNSGLCRSM